jgi:hypothetical protein
MLSSDVAREWRSYERVRMSVLDSWRGQFLGDGTTR